MLRIPPALIAIAWGLIACSGGDRPRDSQPQVCAVEAVSTSAGLPPWERQSTLVVVPPSIYWSTPGFGVDACGGGGFHVAPVAGGPSKLVSADCVYSLTLAPDTMFWLASPLYGYLQEQVWSASLLDTTVTHHTDLPRYVGTIHWASTMLLGARTDGIVQMGADGTFSGFLVQNPLSFSTDFVTADAANAYYIQTNFNAKLQQVMKIPLGGGAPEAIASRSCMDCLSDLVVDSGSLLWIDKDVDPSTFAETGAVMRAPSAGGMITELARGYPAPFESAPAALAVAGGYVYWTNLDSRSGGTIMKTPLAGGPTTALIAHRNWVGTGLAVYDRYVYFIGLADGATPTADPPPDRILYRTCR